MFKKINLLRWFIMAVLLTAVFVPVSFGAKNANAFRVLDVSERTFDGGPSIAVLLSEPLNPRIRHDAYLRISDKKKMLKSVWVLSEDNRTLYYTNVEPQTTYSVTILDRLKSAKGNVLGIRVAKTIKTRKITPAVSFASSGFILPAKMTDGLPIATVNVSKVDIEFFRINDHGLSNFVDWSNITGKESYYKLEDIRGRYGKLVFTGRFDLKPPKNKRVVKKISVQRIKPLKKPGLYIAVMREPGEYNYRYSTTYFLVTDIGLHVRVFEKKVMVVASSISTGKPIKNAVLTFFDNKSMITKGKTGTDGTYQYSGKFINKFAVLKATHNGQVGILPMRIAALDMSAFDISGRNSNGREVYLYSPRDLYRPGENVVLSALLRDYDGREVPAMPLNVRLIRPDNTSVKSFTWQPKKLKNALNYYEKSIQIPGGAQTGEWRIDVRDNPRAATPAGTYKFHVEDFMPERMKLDLESSQTFLDGKTSFGVNITGEYLYGAPASENLIESRVFIRAERNPFSALGAAFKDFEFGDTGEKNYTDYWQNNDEKLNELGKTTLEIENNWSSLTSPMAVHATVSLFESGGRPVVRTIKRNYLPASELVGIRKLFDDTIDEGPINFEIVNTDPHGNLLSAKNIMVDIVKEDRDYFWEYSDSRGWNHRFVEKNYTYLSDSLSFDESKPYKYTAHLKRGRYLLRIKNTRTNLVTSTRFNVGWWWGSEGGEKGSHPDKVLLKLDKRAYLPGDIVRVTVTPPHSGEGLLLVEGKVPLWSKRTKFSAKGTVVEIPVDASWDSHDIYINAIVFRPGDAKSKISPNRAIGLIHLPLDRTDRVLSIDIEAPEKTEPQTLMSVRLKMDQKPAMESVDAYVTLAAVDVGVLNITDFKSPKPDKWFFEKRRYNVLGYDVYSKIVEFLDGASARIRLGGDADLSAGGKKPETKVKILSLFNGPVSFDENGEAKVDLDLSDFNGKMRLMAVAFTKDRFGSAETDVIVASKIVTQLAMPRFLAPGDKTEFTMDVHNMSGMDSNVKLDLRAGDPLVLGDGKQELSLADQEKKILRFPVTAKKAFGGSEILLDIESDDYKINRDWQLGVRPGYPGVARKETAILKKGALFKFGSSLKLNNKLTGDIMESTLEADIKISPVIPLDVKQAMKGLLQYPYGCLEQTTSRAFPLLYVDSEAFRAMNIPVELPGEKVDMLNKGIARIAAMQKHSGGYGLWSKDSEEEPWLTVYATDFLLYARDQGIEVPKQMMEKSLKRIEHYFKRGVSIRNYYGDAKHMDFSVRSYAAYVLSRLNRASLGTLRTLYDNHSADSKTKLPLIHAGIALYRMGDAKRGKNAVAAALAKQQDKWTCWYDYGSGARDNAMAIALLLEHKIKIKELYVMMLDLQKQLKGRKWLNTQEKFAIFKAGIMLADEADDEWTAKIKIGYKSKTITHRGTYIYEPTVKEIVSGIEVSAQNEKMLFATTVVTGYTKTPPVKDESKIRIERQMYDLDGVKIAKKQFNVDELLVVKLDVRSLEMLPDALVVDLLPAGFEIENQNLNHSVKIENIVIDGRAIWKRLREVSMKHEEFRDDRYVAAIEMEPAQEYSLFYLVRVVSPGVFTVPPPMAESMYRPEIRGTGEPGGIITIVNSSR